MKGEEEAGGAESIGVVQKLEEEVRWLQRERHCLQRRGVFRTQRDSMTAAHCDIVPCDDHAQLYTEALVRLGSQYLFADDPGRPSI